MYGSVNAAAHHNPNKDNIFYDQKDLFIDRQRNGHRITYKYTHSYNSKTFAAQTEPRSLTSLGNGTRNVPPSHIERYLGIEVERPGLRGSFLISGLKESVS
ncbi:hypothetical protein TNCV_4848891 [Trichonephila clavipes]|nr:hypothetical protein TNCV_4848891 [Trichonephila clavipes]